jgi:hypothetical protein
MIRSIVPTQFCETAIAAKIGDVLEFFASVLFRRVQNIFGSAARGVPMSTSSFPVRPRTRCGKITTFIVFADFTSGQK